MPRLLDRFAVINKELWLLLTIFLIALLLNHAVGRNHVILGFYAFPTIFSAYYYGRRHAVLTALASVLLVTLLLKFDSAIIPGAMVNGWQDWADIVVWGGLLLVTAYVMGTLYEQRERHIVELRRTYHGVLMILCHFISKDNYTQNHCYRVSVYASQIAIALGLRAQQVEEVRAAALLHDIGKLDVSRDLLHKAGRLTSEEFQEMSNHVERGADLLDPVGGSLQRIIPLILAHHDKFDGSGHHPVAAEDIPLGARIIAVADVYDALTSDRPYRKAMGMFEAKEYIVGKAREEFDPVVVDAFASAFRHGLMELPEVLV